MLKRLHSRYVVFAIVLVAMSYLVMGTMLFVVSTRSSYAEKHSVMEQSLGYSAQAVPLLFDRSTSQAKQLAENALTLVSNLSGTDITVLDKNGVLMFTTSDAVDSSASLSAEQVITYAESNEGFVGTADSLFSVKQSVLPAAIRTDKTDIIGVVFISSPVGIIEDHFESFFRIFMLSALGTLFLAIIAIFFITNRLLRPLKEMKQASQKYAKGQFDVRIAPTGIEEVDALGTSFNNMAESLARIEDMRRGFIQSVSHDLRTPMTSISGFVDGMLDGTIPPEQYNYYLGLVSEESKRLTRLVSTLLEVSEIEAKESEEKKDLFDICEDTRVVVLGFENRFVDKRLKLKMDIPSDPILCKANRDGIHRVIYNIVENAIKYSFDEGSIFLSVTATNDNAIVAVHNTGMGVKPDDMPFIFDRFYKADKSRGIDTKSMGLGLYITKMLVEKNGGNITVRSHFGEFCEFSFTVPLQK